MIRCAGLLAGLALTIGMASCHSDNHDNPSDPEGNDFTVSSSDCFNTLITGHDTTAVTGVGYTVVYNMTNKTSNLSIYGLVDKAGATPRNYTFSSLPWRYDSDKNRIIEVENAYADGDRSTAFKDIEVFYRPEQDLNGVKMHTLAISYTVSPATKVCMVPDEITLTGTSSTTSAMGGEPFVSTSMTYTIYPDPMAGTAKVLVHKPAFAAAMPTLGDMVFDGLRLELTEKGFRCTSESLIPSIGDVPYPKYMITNILVDVNLGTSDCIVKFNCMGAFLVSAVCVPLQPIE